jgi:hypothetical protein
MGAPAKPGGCRREFQAAAVSQFHDVRGVAPLDGLDQAVVVRSRGQRTIGRCRDQAGLTDLHHAVVRGRGVVRLLVERSASLDVKDKHGRTR